MIYVLPPVYCHRSNFHLMQDFVVRLFPVCVPGNVTNPEPPPPSPLFILLQLSLQFLYYLNKDKKSNSRNRKPHII